MAFAQGLHGFEYALVSGLTDFPIAIDLAIHIAVYRRSVQADTGLEMNHHILQVPGTACICGIDNVHFRLVPLVQAGQIEPTGIIVDASQSVDAVVAEVEAICSGS